MADGGAGGFVKMDTGWQRRDYPVGTDQNVVDAGYWQMWVSMSGTRQIFGAGLEVVVAVAGDAVEDMDGELLEIDWAASSCLFVGGEVDRDGAGQGFEELDETEGKGTGYSRMTAYVDREIVQKRTWQGIASHCEVELEWAAAEVVPGSSAVDIGSVKHTIPIHQHWHWGVHRSLVTGVCLVRVVEDGYTLESSAEDVFV
ncbi:hypothetical protein IFR05_016360 [Cadophora sp. M221]|nr:hypothetical protein IFR05_016360 [Cadophora sp. M221]